MSGRPLELLLEIGTEEIPARFIPKALEDLAALARASLAERRLFHGEILTCGTPRRLAVCVREIAPEQPDLEREVVGPAKKAAYGPDGRLSKAGQGFARSQGLEEKDLQVRVLPKGEYLVAVKREVGRSAAEILREEVPAWVAALRFPKSMRWGSGEFRFVRPVHWILALLGGRVLEFELEGLRAGAETRGHRFLAPAPFPVAGYEDYLEKTRRAFVLVDPGERRRRIALQVEAEAAARGGRAVLDPELLDHVTNLVEWPVAVCGGFDPAFLAVPSEVLVTAMKSHQKYFTVQDGAGNLLPWFVTVSNQQAADMSLIRAGNERVLRARLADARFFWEEDSRHTLAGRVPSLGTVVYQERLGSYLEKVERVRELARFLAREAGGCAEEDAARAAYLSKADLVTGMVGEFPELQGVMGRHYAARSGEKPEIAGALLEAYLPRFAGDALPASELGATLSVADRLDTIAGIFGIGLAPTGSEDPYALRRHTLAVIHILAGRAWPVHLYTLVELAIATLSGKLTGSAEEVRAEVLEFFRGRMEHLFAGQGHPPDVVRAVLAAGFDRVPEVRRRIEALAELRALEEFPALAATFKRVANIVPAGFAGEVDTALLADPIERELHEAATAVRAEVDSCLWERDYLGALRRIAALRPVVDGFFDGVMVMAEDPRLRGNRLALLAGVARLFADIADFRQLGAA